MYEYYTQNGYLVIKIKNDLVVGEHQSLEKFIDNVFTPDLMGCIVDILETTYIDSSGISILLRIKKKFSILSKSFFILVDNKRIEKVFIVSKLDKVLNLRKTFEECVDIKKKENNDTKDSDFKMQEFKIVITSEFSYINVVQHFVYKIMKKLYDFSKTDEYDIKMALEESLTNSIEHGYKDNNIDGLIQVYILCLSDEIIIFIDDYGRGYDKNAILKKVDETKKDPFSKRGRGFMILEKITDNIHYDSVENKVSSIIIAKKLKLK